MQSGNGEEGGIRLLVSWEAIGIDQHLASHQAFKHILILDSHSPVFTCCHWELKVFSLVLHGFSVPPEKWL